MNPQNGTLRIVQVSPLAQDVQAFLVDGQARNLAPGTLRFYRQKLYPLVDYLKRLGVVMADDVTTAHLRLWLVHLQEHAHTPGGVHGFFRAAKAFFTWLMREGILTHNPMARVKAPKVPMEPLPPVTPEQIRAMLNVCPLKTLIGARDRAILLSLWDSGCRAGEFIGLNVEDLDLDSGALLVRCGKGRKPRVTFLGRKARREVLRYLRLRGAVGGGDPLFAGGKGQRLRYESLRDIVRRRAQEAGIEAPPLHAFRRGFALDSLRNGADVYSLQRMMGHSDLAVLRRYLAQTQDDLRAVHDRAGPVDRLLR